MINTKLLKKTSIIIVIVALFFFLITVSNYVDIPGYEGVERRVHVINIIYPVFVAGAIIYLVIYYIRKAHYSCVNRKKEDSDINKDNN